MLSSRLSFLVFLITCFASGAAFPALEQNDVIEIKAKIEDAITRKYKDLISTRVRNELFSVGTQVTLTVKKEMVDAPFVMPAAEIRGTQNYYSDLPSDISLGVFSSFKSTDNKNSSQDQTQAQILKERIKIIKITVNVGLSPKLGKAYKAQFSTWLNKNILADFGGKGTSSVNEYIEIDPPKAEPEVAVDKTPKIFELKMEPKAIEITMPEPTKARPLNWEERFGQFQNLIGLSVLAIFLMITYFVGKYIPSKDILNQVAAAEKLEELKASQSVVTQSGSGASQKNSGGNPLLDNATSEITIKSKGGSQLALNYVSFQEQQRKIAILASSSKENMYQMTQIWMDTGELGRVKIALVLDCIMANAGKTEISKDSGGNLGLEWAMPESIRNDKGLAKVFQSVAVMDLEAKYELLDKAYWDLLSIRTMGANLTKQRFSGFAQLPVSTIHRILASQDKKSKSITCLHLPPEKLKQVVSSMSRDELKLIIEQAFTYPDMSFADLDFLDNHLNSLIQIERMSSVDNVDLPRMVPGILAAISPAEEIQLIRQLAATNQESTFYLKENYPSVMFLNEWPKDKLKVLLSKAQNLELLALVQTLPELKEFALSLLPGRARAILIDDLESKILTDEELNIHLTDIRNRLFDMHENNEIDLLQIFNNSQGLNTTKAA